MRSTRLPSWIERLLGGSALPGPPHVFFLDERELVYGRFSARGEGCAVEETHAIELPAAAFHGGLLGGTVRDEEAFGELLRELLGRVSVPVAQASLVLPDAWLRVAFTEVDELPRDAAKRLELLRWKLKRLLPFRVEELRVQGVEVSPLADREGEKRLLLGFGLESLLGQLETLFGRAGVALGRITSASLGLLAALDSRLGEHLLALALVRTEGYTLIFARRGEPVLHRYKAFTSELPFSAQQRLVGRDLRLTRTFLDDHFPDTPLERAVLAAAPDLEGPWAEWLAADLGARVETLDREHLLPLEPAATLRPWPELAPMVGAGCQEIA